MPNNVTIQYLGRGIAHEISVVGQSMQHHARFVRLFENELGSHQTSTFLCSQFLSTFGGKITAHIDERGKRTKHINK